MKEAFASANLLYIYLLHEDVLLLKKETAIISKSRVENPFYKHVEAEDQAFYDRYGLLESMPEGKFEGTNNIKIEDVQDKLNRVDDVFLIANAAHGDQALIAIYGLN